MKPSIDNYILDEDWTPVKEPDFLKFAKWLETADRIVARTKIQRSTVSTVFLGLDHNWLPQGPPILWETLVFDGKLKDAQTRCSGTRQDAEAMHAKMVKRVRAAYAKKRKKKT